MDYDQLLDSCCEMGCRMLSCGAEIHRVEDTVSRLLAAYDLESEAFAIPNCFIVSIIDGDGHIHTRMRRASAPKTDIALLEEYNALSRRLCAEPPSDPKELAKQIHDVPNKIPHYSIPTYLIGTFIGAAFFALFFYGGITEALIGGIAGLAAGLFSILLDRLHCNFFIATIISGFALAFVVYGFSALGVAINIQVTVAGAIMVLVPGLVFTYFLSDLLAGDVVAGVSTFVRAMLSACAIAIGTIAAMAIFRNTSAALSTSDEIVSYHMLLPCLFAAIACCGFCFTFNIHGKGMPLCGLGGGLGWLVYELILPLSGGRVYIPTLVAAITVAAYAEIMARVRKCPATPYLLVSFFPLVPGLTIYQALDYGIRGDLELFWESLFRTFGVAGCLALGSLIVTSIVKMLHARKPSFLK